MRLFNSLTSQSEELKTLKSKVVSLYSCGPTVYDHAHIGNLRTFIMDDLVRRTLRAEGYEVQAVMNITDVDDKTIARSRSDYPDLSAEEGLEKLTRHYEKLFKADLDAVGIDLSGVTRTRATEYIPQMQALIAAIAQAGYAYESDGSVYLDVAKFSQTYDYGVLVNIDFKPQARIDSDEYDKQEARDFALWKAAKAGEPSWDLEFEGKTLPGRPGWHIECSAMSADKLGVPFDIHTGGIDLKFPHHENEIAQTRAATGQQLASYFVHHNHLLVDGKKMSKSANNFYTLEHIKAKGFDPLAFRLLCLQAGHNSELNFTWESLQAAQNNLQNLRAWADLRHQSFDHAALAGTYELQLKEILLAVGNDFDGPAALAIVNDMAARAADTPDAKAVAEAVQAVDGLLGLDLGGSEDISAEQKQLIKSRESARAQKDFAQSDELRQQLTEQGIEIEDTPRGPRWRRA